MFDGVFDMVLDPVFDAVFDAVFDGAFDAVFDGLSDGVFDGLVSALGSRLGDERAFTSTCTPVGCRFAASLKVTDGVLMHSEGVASILVAMLSTALMRPVIKNLNSSKIKANKASRANSFKLRTRREERNV